MRRLIAAGLLTFLLAGIGYAIYWHMAARALEDGIARWIAERRAEGYQVSAADPEIDGFPLRLRARFDAPVIEAPPEAGAWRWAGPTVQGAAAPWDPLRIDLTMPGRHELSWDAGGERRALNIDTAAADGQVQLTRDGHIEDVDADLAELKLANLLPADLAAAGTDEDSVTIERMKLTAELPSPRTDHGRRGAELRLSLSGLLLPADDAPPLGREIQRVEAEGTLMGRIPPGSATEALTAWRDDGGTLEVRRLTLAWGPLDLTAEGTFALDQTMQPLAAATATIRGHGETVDALVEQGIVEPREGSIARLLLTALSRTPEDGGRPEIQVALTVQDGFLYVGRIKLIPLPDIRWP